MRAPIRTLLLLAIVAIIFAVSASRGTDVTDVRFAVVVFVAITAVLFVGEFIRRSVQDR